MVHSVLNGIGWWSEHEPGREEPMVGIEERVVAKRGLHDEDEGWEERLFDLPDGDDEDDDSFGDDDLDEDLDDADLDDEDDDADLEDLDEDE
jgi:hypothetical protein